MLHWRGVWGWRTDAVFFPPCPWWSCFGRASPAPTQAHSPTLQVDTGCHPHTVWSVPGTRRQEGSFAHNSKEFIWSPGTEYNHPRMRGKMRKTQNNVERVVLQWGVRGVGRASLSNNLRVRGCRQGLEGRGKRTGGQWGIDESRTF